MMITYLVRFLEKHPLRTSFQKCFPKGFTASRIHVFCANFVKFGRLEVGEIARCLPDKKENFASARIAPKICQSQLRTTYSDCPKFHPNPFTSGAVIAERVHVAETRTKCFQYSAKLQLLRRVITTMTAIAWILDNQGH